MKPIILKNYLNIQINKKCGNLIKQLNMELLYYLNLFPE